MVLSLKSFLPPVVIYQVGNAIINSTIQYGAALWGATSISNVSKVQSAQIRAGRLLSGKWCNQEVGLHRQELLDTMNWSNVTQLIASSSLNMVKSSISNNSSLGFNCLFRVTKPVSKLRNKSLRVDHCGPPSRTMLSFSANASSLFNKLPPYLKEQNLNPKHFKIKLKDYMKTSHLLPHH